MAFCEVYNDLTSEAMNQDGRSINQLAREPIIHGMSHIYLECTRKKSDRNNPTLSGGISLLIPNGVCNICGSQLRGNRVVGAHLAFLYKLATSLGCQLRSNLVASAHSVQLSAT